MTQSPKKRVRGSLGSYRVGKGDATCDVDEVADSLVKIFDNPISSRISFAACYELRFLAMAYLTYKKKHGPLPKRKEHKGE